MVTRGSSLEAFQIVVRVYTQYNVLTVYCIRVFAPCCSGSDQRLSIRCMLPSQLFEGVQGNMPKWPNTWQVGQAISLLERACIVIALLAVFAIAAWSG